MNQRGAFSKHVTSFLEFLPAWQCFFYFWNGPYPSWLKKKSQNITWNKYTHLYPWLCAPRKTMIDYNLIISSLDIQVLQHITLISNGKEHPPPKMLRDNMGLLFPVTSHSKTSDLQFNMPGRKWHLHFINNIKWE